jgi:hypothetical protein
MISMGNALSKAPKVPTKIIKTAAGLSNTSGGAPFIAIPTTTANNPTIIPATVEISKLIPPIPPRASCIPLHLQLFAGRQNKSCLGEKALLFNIHLHYIIEKKSKKLNHFWKKAGKIIAIIV